jgi:hypothetical protein
VANDLTRTLYRLIEADLKNDARNQEMKPFDRRVFLSPILFPAFGKAPYIVVTPGNETGDEARGEDRDLDVLVWVVTSIMRDSHSKPELLGTAGIDDGGSLVRAVRRSLARPIPYRADLYASSPYPATPAADRGAILSCKWIQTGPYEVVPQPKSDPEAEEIVEDLHLARPVTMRYEMVEVG